MISLEPKTALGLYSDSSAVYIDACLLQTDGLDILSEPLGITRPYSAELRSDLLSLSPENMTDISLLTSLSQRITAEHFTVADELLEKYKRQIPQVDIIGYSGHSVWLSAPDKINICLGNGDTLAQQLKIPLINDFVFSDLRAGGTGGPVLTTFVEAITRNQPKPLAFVSLSGKSTMTYIGTLGELKSFEIGVGCLLLDKWLQRHAGIEMDFDGQWAAKGRVEKRLLSYLLKDDYLKKQPPKTLDRNSFEHLLSHVEGCSPENGAATLTAFIAESIAAAARFLPEPPKKWILSGGGTLNPTLILWLKKILNSDVETINEAQMPTYNLDAAGYAFLAVRSLMQLPITFPGTTGVSMPMTGGTYHTAVPNETD